MKGDIAELRVASHLIHHGWTVSLPVGARSRYDLVAERNGKFLRIQVKFVTPKKGGIDINCRSSNNWSVLHYSEKEIDTIAAFDGKTEQIYFIPVTKINYSSFKIRYDEPKNGQSRGIHLANEFLTIE